MAIGKVVKVSGPLVVADGLETPACTMWCASAKIV